MVACRSVPQLLAVCCGRSPPAVAGSSRPQQEVACGSRESLVAVDHRTPYAVVGSSHMWAAVAGGSR